MDNLVIKGKVIKVGDIFTSQSGFSWREFVVNIPQQNTNYENNVPMKLIKEKVGEIVPVVGQEVEVSFDIRGREWNGRHYVGLVCWKLVPCESQPSPAPSQQKAEPKQPFAQKQGTPNPMPVNNPEGTEDLPF